MNKKLILRGGVAMLACAALSGCLGNGTSGVAGGGTGGGAGGGADYETNLTRVQNLGPQTERQTGTVNYAGQTRLESTGGPNNNINGHIIGDVAIAANFDNETLTGTATNFQGEVNGQAVTLAGTLSTANITGNDPNVVAQQDIQLPPVAGGGTVTSGSLIANMRGTLTESIDNESSTAQLALIGTFMGANADAASGGATMLVGSEEAVGFGIAGGGTFYMDRQ